MDNTELEKDWGQTDSKWTGAQVQAFIKKWLKGLNEEKVEKPAADGKYYLLHNGVATEVTLVDDSKFEEIWGSL